MFRISITFTIIRKGHNTFWQKGQRAWALCTPLLCYMTLVALASMKKTKQNNDQHLQPLFIMVNGQFCIHK